MFLTGGDKAKLLLLLLILLLVVVVFLLLLLLLLLILLLSWGGARDLLYIYGYVLLVLVLQMTPFVWDKEVVISFFCF